MTAPRSDRPHSHSRMDSASFPFRPLCRDPGCSCGSSQSQTKQPCRSADHLATMPKSTNTTSPRSNLVIIDLGRCPELFPGVGHQRLHCARRRWNVRRGHHPPTAPVRCYQILAALLCPSEAHATLLIGFDRSHLLLHVGKVPRGRQPRQGRPWINDHEEPGGINRPRRRSRPSSSETVVSTVRRTTDEDEEEDEEESGGIARHRHRSRPSSSKIRFHLPFERDGRARARGGNVEVRNPEIEGRFVRCSPTERRRTVRGPWL